MNNSIGFKSTDEYFRCGEFQYSPNKKYSRPDEVNIIKFEVLQENRRYFYDNYHKNNRTFVVKYNHNPYRCTAAGFCYFLTDSLEFIEEITEENVIDIVEKYNCDKNGFLYFSLLFNYKLEILEALVEKGASFQSILTRASKTGNLEIAKFLAEKGVDVKARNS